MRTRHVSCLWAPEPKYSCLGGLINSEQRNESRDIDERNSEFSVSYRVLNC